MIKRLKKNKEFELISQTAYYIRDRITNLDISCYSSKKDAEKDFNDINKAIKKTRKQRGK